MCVYAQQWLLCFLRFGLVCSNEQTPYYVSTGCFMHIHGYTYHHVISELLPFCLIFCTISSTPILFTPISSTPISSQMGTYPSNTAVWLISVHWQNLKTTKAHKYHKSPVKPFNPWKTGEMTKTLPLAKISHSYPPLIWDNSLSVQNESVSSQ